MRIANYCCLWGAYRVLLPACSKCQVFFSSVSVRLPRIVGVVVECSAWRGISGRFRWWPCDSDVSASLPWAAVPSPWLAGCLLFEPSLSENDHVEEKTPQGKSWRVGLGKATWLHAVILECMYTLEGWSGFGGAVLSDPVLARFDGDIYLRLGNKHAACYAHILGIRAGKLEQF